MKHTKPSSATAKVNPRHLRLSPTGLGATLPLPRTTKPETSSFVPKSTIQTYQDQKKLLAAASKKRLSDEEKGSKTFSQNSHGVGTSPRDADEPSVDIFGLRHVNDGDDDFVDEDGGAGGFWMPDLAVVPNNAPPKPTTANRPDEVFDGYHLWQEWHSRTANKPFWHCRETGETRWEKPEAGAVQKPDKAPEANVADSGNLNEGDLDEEANRREFLQALYEWRNGGKKVEEEKKEEAPRKLKAAAKAPSEPSSSRPSSGRATVLSREASARAPQSATLQSAAGNGEAALVRELLEGGSDPNAADRFGLTALHYAAGGGHVAIVESLVAAKANVASCDKDGDTPLHNAVKGGREGALRRLLELGADAEAVNGKGNTAARVAAMFGRAGLAAMLGQAAQIRAEAAAARARAEAAGQGSSAQPEAAAAGESPARGSGVIRGSGVAVKGGGAGGKQPSTTAKPSTSTTSTTSATTTAATAAAAPVSSSGTDSEFRTHDVAAAKPLPVQHSPTTASQRQEPLAPSEDKGAAAEAEEERARARALLEGLRMRAREEAEVKYGSRPSSASSRGTPRD